MAKKHPKTPIADAAVDTSAASTETTTEAVKKPAIGVRGPKGVALTAKITVLAATNPKRLGSKSHVMFDKYVNGMTIQEWIDVAGDFATPAIVYDTKHGFISVEGYVVEVLPPKAPREPKAPKAAKAPKVKAEKVDAPPADEELQRETEETEA